MYHCKLSSTSSSFIMQSQNLNRANFHSNKSVSQWTLTSTTDTGCCCTLLTLCYNCPACLMPRLPCSYYHYYYYRVIADIQLNISRMLSMTCLNIMFGCCVMLLPFTLYGRHLTSSLRRITRAPPLVISSWVGASSLVVDVTLRSIPYIYYLINITHQPSMVLLI